MAPKPTTDRQRAATLADVGREAGVSAMAASAVLNGAKTSTRIADDTRARILAAAERLQYRPNGAARGLAEQRMHTLGLATLLPGDELNQYFLEVFNGIVEAAARAGQSTTVFALEDWRQGASRLAALCDGRIDGMILLAPLLQLDDAASLPTHTPFVAVHANHALPGVVNIESDEEAGALAMVRQMIALGHRRILHLAGPTGSVGAARRVAGWRRAHAEAGLEPPPQYLVPGEFSIESGRVALEAWLQRHRGEPLPQAIFAVNDAVALGCQQTLAARGLRVPEDLSLVGFDDTLLARTAGLATVRQPLRELGHRAVELLVQRIEARAARRPDPAGPTQVLATEPVLRASLAAPAPTSRTVA